MCCILCRAADLNCAPPQSCPTLTACPLKKWESVRFQLKSTATSDGGVLTCTNTWKFKLMETTIGCSHSCCKWAMLLPSDVRKPHRDLHWLDKLILLAKASFEKSASAIIHCAVLFRAKSSVQKVQKRVIGQKEKGQGLILILNSFYIWLFGVIIRLPIENMPTNGLGTSCLLYLSVYHEWDQP